MHAEFKSTILPLIEMLIDLQVCIKNFNSQDFEVLRIQMDLVCEIIDYIKTDTKLLFKCLQKVCYL